MNQKKKTKRAFNGLAGSPLAKRPRKVKPEPEEPDPIEVLDGRTGLVIPVPVPDPVAKKPLTPKQRKQRQRSNQAEKKRRQAITETVLTSKTGDTTGRQRNESVKSPKQIEKIFHGKTENSFLEPPGIYNPTMPDVFGPSTPKPNQDKHKHSKSDRRRVQPEGHGASSDEPDAQLKETTEKEDSFVRKQPFSLNWGLSQEEIDGFTLHFTKENFTGEPEVNATEYDSTNPKADQYGYVQTHTLSTLVCGLCGGNVKNGQEATDHIESQHAKELREYLKFCAPARVDAKRKCPEAEHERIRKLLIQSGEKDKVYCKCGIVLIDPRNVT